MMTYTILIIVLLTINFIVVELVDRQNIANKIANFISKRLTNNTLTNVWVNKPFNCSYCMTFWISLLFLLFNVQFTFLGILFAVAMALFNAMYTHFTYYILETVSMFIRFIFNKLHKHLHNMLTQL